MMTDNTSDRRSFLKAGALVAAPLAVVTAPAALADDGSRARLARLEDEREIAALDRAMLRQLNAHGHVGTSVADNAPIALASGLRSITLDPAADTVLNFAVDGKSAASRQSVIVEREREVAGHSTVERMTRFQGGGSHRLRESHVLAAHYTKGASGWRIARLTLA